LTTKARVEALVDGIFAVSMTLLVLDIKLPEGARIESNADLINHFAAIGQLLEVYVLSFAVLAMYWVAHGYQFRFVDRVDKPLLWLNFAFLLLTTTVPFTTNLVSAHGNLSVAVTVYAANLLLLGGALFLHLHRLRHHPDLTTKELTPDLGSSIQLRLSVICAVTLLAAALAQLTPTWGLRSLYVLALLHFSPHRPHQHQPT
jgi:uncharacterized membrane protein